MAVGVVAIVVRSVSVPASVAPAGSAAVVMATTAYDAVERHPAAIATTRCCAYSVLAITSIAVLTHA